MTVSETPSSPSVWASDKLIAEAKLSTDSGKKAQQMLDRLKEERVFFKQMAHKGAGADWIIKIGKGGQIYSIKAPLTSGAGFEELIAKQRVEAGQWVDEVLQHTMPMIPHKDPAKVSDVVDGDIHQAGYYMKSDIEDIDFRPGSVFSPLFNYEYVPKYNRVSYITWPQHAHLPRYKIDTTLPSGMVYEAANYKNNLLLIKQTVTDIDNGVIQIDLEYSKWGGADHPKFTVPKVTFRESTVPTQIISTSAGTYVSKDQGVNDLDTAYRLGSEELGTWFASVKADSPDARGIGLVFGKPSSPAPGVFRYYTYLDSTKAEPDLKGTSAFVLRNADLKAGETLKARYFLILGTLSKIEKEAAKYEGEVIFEKYNRPMSEAGSTLICQDTASGVLVSRCIPGTTTPVFKAFREFVAGAQPLFLMRNKATLRLLLTNNPYETNFDPSEAKVDYLDFLGWALPSTVETDACKSQLLSTFNLGIPLGKETSGLKVMKLLKDKNCPGS